MEVADEIDKYEVVLPAYFEQQHLYKQSLSFFNISHKLVLEQNSLNKFEALFTIDNIALSGNFIPENIEKTRRFFLSKIKSNVNLGRNIYISRKKAKRRFVENENEVEQLLLNHGYKIVCMEDYRFEEQISIVCNAKNLISIHGAALSLIMFMPVNGNVAEFRKEYDNHNDIFYHLADAAALNYYYLSCSFKNVSDNANNFNLTVDITQLNQLCDEMNTRE